MIQHPPKELLPPAAADCTAAKIDTHRRRELETKTITCPPKRVSSRVRDLVCCRYAGKPRRPGRHTDLRRRRSRHDFHTTDASRTPDRGLFLVPRSRFCLLICCRAVAQSNLRSCASHAGFLSSRALQAASQISNLVSRCISRHARTSDNSWGNAAWSAADASSQGALTMVGATVMRRELGAARAG